MTIYQRLRLWHRALRYALRTEPAEIALVRNLIKSGDSVIDIGAHKAGFSWWMARAVGKTGRVACFEPIPALADYMRSVAGVYRDGRMQIYETALSEQAGTTKLNFSSPNLGCASLEDSREMAFPSIEVEVVTLDEWAEAVGVVRPIRFIKCDVESHELFVFRGGKKLLQRDRPVLLFESTNLADGRDHNRQVFAFLESLGYEGRFFYGQELVPLTEYDPYIHKPTRTNQNFVFTHREQTKWESSAPPYRVTNVEPSVARAA